MSKNFQEPLLSSQDEQVQIQQQQDGSTATSDTYQLNEASQCRVPLTSQLSLQAEEYIEDEYPLTPYEGLRAKVPSTPCPDIPVTPVSEIAIPATPPIGVPAIPFPDIQLAIVDPHGR